MNYNHVVLISLFCLLGASACGKGSRFSDSGLDSGSNDANAVIQVLQKEVNGNQVSLELRRGGGFPPANLRPVGTLQGIGSKKEFIAPDQFVRELKTEAAAVYLIQSKIGQLELLSYVKGDLALAIQKKGKLSYQVIQKELTKPFCLHPIYREREGLSAAEARGIFYKNYECSYGSETDQRCKPIDYPVALSLEQAHFFYDLYFKNKELFDCQDQQWKAVVVRTQDFENSEILNEVRLELKGDSEFEKITGPVLHFNF